MALTFGDSLEGRNAGTKQKRHHGRVPKSTRPAASKPCENVAGRAEETRRKARMIGDVEIDEPVHGRDHYARIPGETR